LETLGQLVWQVFIDDRRSIWIKHAFFSPGLYADLIIPSAEPVFNGGLTIMLTNPY